MPVVVFDTTALLRLLLPEPGNELACALWNRADVLVASRLADAEVRSVLAAGVRSARIEPDEHAAALARWEECWPALRVVEVGPDLAGQAARLAHDHGLRAGDGVVLAGALLLADAEPILAAWDGRLAAAAQAEGIRTIP